MPVKTANALVMQSGGCTPVLNRSLFGVYMEAAHSEKFGAIYGAAHGVEGILSNDLIDLGKTSKAEWGRIARSPAAALGSTRRKLTPDDIPVLIEVLKKNNVKYWFMIGGNDSAETGHTLVLESKKADWPLTVINVPKTIDNDLVMTDHCPGYGSAARFVAIATMGTGRDAEAMKATAPIAIIEVMGRDTGWLVAAAALAKRHESDAPHIVLPPELPVYEDRFLEKVEDAYRKYGFAVAVVAENARGPDGPVGGQDEPWFVDDFGHPYYDGPARYLAGLARKHLNVRARYQNPGTIQRSFAECISRADVQEAEMSGRAAVRYALEGHSDKLVTLVREAGQKYRCTTGLAPLEEVGGKVKVMPEEYLDAENSFVTQAFIDYVRPLIGNSLPQFGRLR